MLMSAGGIAGILVVIYRLVTWIPNHCYEETKRNED